MSYSIDANILIYASNRESPYHKQAIEFLSTCLKDSEPIYLCWPTVFSYLRISTHPNIFNAPLSPDEAIHNVETLRASSHVRFIHEGDQFWDRYSEINNDQIIRGIWCPMHTSQACCVNKVSAECIP